jgi:N-acetylneuraminic acid mutarotase
MKPPKAEWISLTPWSNIQPPRSGHVAFTAKDRLFLFGGYAEDEDLHRYVTNDLWEWKDGGWEKQKPSGDAHPRLVSSSVVMNDSAYIMGGWDPQTEGTGGVILNTVNKLSLAEDTLSWTELAAELPDGPASRHVALAYKKNKAFLHNHRCDDHVWVFDGDEESFSKQLTKGTAPTSRGLHAATMANSNTAVIFGGAAKDGIMSNEAFLLNTDTWSWTPIETEGDCPSPRAGACLACYSDSCVLLFGGAESSFEAGLVPKGDVWALEFDSETGKGEWTQLLPDEQDSGGPEPRNAATLSKIDAIDDRGGKYYLLTGGWAPFRKTWNDCFVLRVADE